MEAYCGAITTESKIKFEISKDGFLIHIGTNIFSVNGEISQISQLKKALDEAYKLGFTNCATDLMPKLMKK